MEIYLFVVFAVSSFLQTTTGFGYALIMSPLLALALDPKETVMLTIVTSPIVKLLMMRSIRSHGSFKDVSLLLKASFIGVIPGGYIMTVVSGDSLKIFIGVVLILATLVLWRGVRFSAGRHKWAEHSAGFMSGFLSATTGIGGPPIILYYLNANAEKNKEVFRGNLTRLFLAINLASIVVSFILGTLVVGALYDKVLMAVPAICIGVYAGQKAFDRINVQTLKNLSLIMVLASSFTLIGTVMLK